MIEILCMPKLGESVNEGVITKWLKKPGDFVEKYEAICEIATDKVNAEVPSTVSGKIIEILADVGETLEINKPICKILVNVLEKEENKNISPAVIKIVQEYNLNLDEVLSKVKGTGYDGRITKNDVLNYVKSVTKPSFKKDKELHFSALRKTIADKMKKSKQEIPHAWLSMEVDVSKLVVLRKEVKENFIKEKGIKVTYLPFFIKATTMALRDFPILNSILIEGKILQKEEINISIAIGGKDFLYVPVIKDADKKDIFELALVIKKLKDKAKNKDFCLEDFSDGTFTVNNTGSFGSILSYPIINSPQVAILSFEAIVKRPIVKDNMLGIADIMNLCLSIDHRVLDGFLAGSFLKKIKENLEQPNFMLKNV